MLSDCIARTIFNGCCSSACVWRFLAAGGCCESSAVRISRTVGRCCVSPARWRQLVQPAAGRQAAFVSVAGQRHFWCTPVTSAPPRERPRGPCSANVGARPCAQRCTGCAGCAVLPCGRCKGSYIHTRMTVHGGRQKSAQTHSGAVHRDQGLLK